MHYYQINTFPAIGFVFRINTLPPISYVLIHHLKAFYKLKIVQYALFNYLFHLSCRCLLRFLGIRTVLWCTSLWKSSTSEGRSSEATNHKWVSRWQTPPPSLFKLSLQYKELRTQYKNWEKKKNKHHSTFIINLHVLSPVYKIRHCSHNIKMDRKLK